MLASHHKNQSYPLALADVCLQKRSLLIVITGLILNNIEICFFKENDFKTLLIDFDLIV